MIASILKALEHWLLIQSIRARWELERDIEYHVSGCENEIRKARASGDDARADLLRHRLLRTSGVILPRAPDYAVERGGDAHSDKR